MLQEIIHLLQMQSGKHGTNLIIRMQD